MLGVARLRAGDATGAVDALKKAKDLARADNAALCFYLAMAQWNAGGREMARRSYEQGRALLEKSRNHDRELHALQAQAAVLLGVQKQTKERN